MPQATIPLLIPPLNQLAQLAAARAHGENAENAQEGRGLLLSIKGGSHARSKEDDDTPFIVLTETKPQGRSCADGLLTETRARTARRMLEAKSCPDATPRRPSRASLGRSTANPALATTRFHV